MKLGLFQSRKLQNFCAGIEIFSLSEGRIAGSRGGRGGSIYDRNDIGSLAAASDAVDICEKDQEIIGKTFVKTLTHTHTKIELVAANNRGYIKDVY